MASTCDVYKNGILLGAGTCAAGSATISSYTANASRVCARRNVQIVVTQAGTHVGRSWNTRVLTESSSLTLVDACPFVGA